MQIEIPSILESFKEFGEDYQPKFAEIIVTKRIDDRFFYNREFNPEPGTIIYSDVISKKFEYFLIA